MPRTALALLLSVSPLLLASPSEAAPPVGKKAGPYSFLVATGPQRGQPTCYVCEQGDKPTAVVFARTTSAPLGTLMARLDAAAAARKADGFKAWLTVLTPTADLDALAKWAQTHALKETPVGAFEDADGPPAYTLAADADVTVVLFVKRAVVGTFAIKAGELTDAKMAEIVKALPAAAKP